MSPRRLLHVCLLLAAILLFSGVKSSINEDVPEQTDFYSFFAMDINDNIVSFEQYRGQVTLVVNVASECGYTDSHYKGLNLLQQLFSDTEKFDIIAFPCNQFGGQEPGTLREINEFAYNRMSAQFLLFSKTDVIGGNAPPLWKYLIEESGHSPTWNFWKYLVDHKGKVVGAWPPEVKPQQIYQNIEDAISKIDNDQDADEDEAVPPAKHNRDEF